MIKEAIRSVVGGKSLTMEEAAGAMNDIMSGLATPAQVGAFMTALRMKGETADEIAGLASVMRAKATPVKAEGPVLDTCGTGGDGLHTFNISTAAAFVAAGAGLKVAKHGNRSMSSQCGSADVLEALGVRIELDAEQAGWCLEEVGMCFMFAPLYHPAMKHAAAPRRELGIRTVFNLLGPLTNPAGAAYQVIGVPERGLVEKIAAALCRLGTKHALVVHGSGGMDEISVAGKSVICEVRDGVVSEPYHVSPSDFGLKRAPLATLKGGSAAENAAIIRQVLGAQDSPRRTAVLLNAGAALVAGERVADMADGVRLASETIDSGHARAKLGELVKFTQGL